MERNNYSQQQYEEAYAYFLNEAKKAEYCQRGLRLRYIAKTAKLLGEGKDLEQISQEINRGIDTVNRYTARVYSFIDYIYHGVPLSDKERIYCINEQRKTTPKSPIGYNMINMYLDEKLEDFEMDRNNLIKKAISGDKKSQKDLMERFKCKILFANGKSVEQRV